MVTHNNGFVGFSFWAENTQPFQLPVFQDCILSHNEMSSLGVLPTKLFNHKAVVETKYTHFGMQNVTAPMIFTQNMHTDNAPFVGFTRLSLGYDIITTKQFTLL